MLNDDNNNLLAPGHGFKFGVRIDDELKSGIWQIGTRKNTNDVYLSIAAIGEVLKVSFHESGKWQFSLTQDFAMQYVERNRDRHLAKWTRPKEFAKGWVRAFYITVPRTELRDHDGYEDVRSAPDPEHDYWVTIDVWFTGSGTDVQVKYPDGAFVLGRLQLFGGGEVLVVARPQAPDASAAAHIRHTREGILRAIGEGKIPGGGPGPGGSTLAAIFLEAADGTPGFIEMAFTEQPTAVRRICLSNDLKSDNIAIYGTHLNRKS